MRCQILLKHTACSGTTVTDAVITLLMNCYITAFATANLNSYCGVSGARLSLLILWCWRVAVCWCESLWVTLSPLPSPQPVDTEGFTHLPPEQRRKRLQQKIDDISKELQKEMDQRWVARHAASPTTISMATGHSWILRVTGVRALFTKLFRSLRNQWFWVFVLCLLSIAINLSLS